MFYISIYYERKLLRIGFKQSITPITEPMGSYNPLELKGSNSVDEKYERHLFSYCLKEH